VVIDREAEIADNEADRLQLVIVAGAAVEAHVHLIHVRPCLDDR